MALKPAYSHAASSAWRTVIAKSSASIARARTEPFGRAGGGTAARRRRAYFRDTIKLAADRNLRLAGRSERGERCHRDTARADAADRDAGVWRPTASRSASSSSTSTCGRALDRVRSSVRPGESIYVVDAKGDYLVHPDRAREFGSQLGTADRLAAATSRIWRPRSAPRKGVSRDLPDRSRATRRRRVRARHSGRQRMGRGHRDRFRTPSSWRRRRQSGTARSPSD